MQTAHQRTCMQHTQSMLTLHLHRTVSPLPARPQPLRTLCLRAYQNKLNIKTYWQQPCFLQGQQSVCPDAGNLDTSHREAQAHPVSTNQTRSIWKMLGTFATASCRTPHCHSPGVATVASHATCTSMSTTMTTTTTMRDRRDCYGPIEWAQSAIAWKEVSESKVTIYAQ